MGKSRHIRDSEPSTIDAHGAERCEAGSLSTPLSFYCKPWVSTPEGRSFRPNNRTSSDGFVALGSDCCAPTVDRGMGRPPVPPPPSPQVTRSPFVVIQGGGMDHMGLAIGPPPSWGSLSDPFGSDAPFSRTLYCGQKPNTKHPTRSENGGRPAMALLSRVRSLYEWVLDLGVEQISRLIDFLTWSDPVVSTLPRALLAFAFILASLRESTRLTVEQLPSETFS